MPLCQKLMRYELSARPTDLDNLQPNLRDLVQDLCCTDPTREHVLNYAGCTAPTRQHELDHAEQDSICPERARSGTIVGIDHTDHTDHLSEVPNHLLSTLDITPPPPPVVALSR